MTWIRQNFLHVGLWFPLGVICNSRHMGARGWRWPETRLIFWPFLGPTSCILALIYISVCPFDRKIVYTSFIPVQPEEGQYLSKPIIPAPREAGLTNTLCLHQVLYWWPCSLHQTVVQVTFVAYHQQQQDQDANPLQFAGISVPRKTGLIQALGRTILYSYREETEQD